MDSVVNKLLDVDRQARQILDEAQQYYDKTIKDLAAEKQKMTADYESREKQYLDKVRVSESVSVTEASAEIESRYESLTAELDNTFESLHPAWEDELFQKCVGR